MDFRIGAYAGLITATIDATTDDTSGIAALWCCRLVNNLRATADRTFVTATKDIFTDRGGALNGDHGATSSDSRFITTAIHTTRDRSGTLKGESRIFYCSKVSKCFGSIEDTLGFVNSRRCAVDGICMCPSISSSSPFYSRLVSSEIVEIIWLSTETNTIQLHNGQ